MAIANMPAEPEDIWGTSSDDQAQTLQFDIKNPEVLAWIDARAGELVRQITEGQRTIIQDILHDSYVKGLTPSETSMRLRQVIGLTAQQGGYVENYYSKLLQQGVNEFKAKTLTEKYRANWVRYRANTIARTETIAASAEGQAQVWQQATTLGYLDPEEFEETWIISPDRITCPECRELEGKRWPIGQGPKPPRHPGCRCSRGLVRKGTGPARTVALPDYVPRDNVYKLQPKVPASAMKASEPSALALLKLAYYSKYTSLQSWSGAWDEAKHPRADNGEFGSGGAGASVSKDHAAWGERASEIAKAKTAPNGMHDDAVIRSAFEGTFAGLATKITEILHTDGGRVETSGDVFKDRKQVGTFLRSTSSDGTIVDHLSLKLSKEVQGGGFAREFNRNAENHYIANGITQVNTHANISVGGYAWAKQGFDAVKLSSLKDDMTEKLRGLANTAGNTMSSTQRSETQHALDSAEHSWDIAAIMTTDRYGKPRAIGKELMLGSNWDAVKSLVPGSLTAVVGEYAYQSKKK